MRFAKRINTRYIIAAPQWIRKWKMLYFCLISQLRPVDLERQVMSAIGIISLVITFAGAVVFVIGSVLAAQSKAEPEPEPEPGAGRRAKTLPSALRYIGQ